MTSEKHLTRHASRIAGGTTVSRVLGYVRDMLVAHTFGAGFAADAFYAAYRIPNLLRRLLGEGSLAASFIPVLSEYLHTKSKEETQELINVVFTVLTVILLALTVLGIVFSPQLVHIIAYGFTSDPEKLQLTIDLTRLMFPFLLFISLAALALGILNAMHSFFIPAVAPASLSVAEIGFLLAVAPLLSPANQIKGLALSVIIGGALQFIAQWPEIRKLGWKLQWKLKFDHPGVKKITVLMMPAMLGLSVDQINAFVNTIIASFLAQGSITALYYSNRVMQMPLAIFGLAMASVALPVMSKAVAEKNTGALKDTLNFSLRLIIFILVPATVGLAVLGLPIIQVLFERGNFDHQATLMTNSALFYYSLGLPAYAAVRVVASVFYSYQETKTPVKVAAAAMIINVLLSIALMKPMGVGGLALATALSSWFNVIVLGVILRKRIGILGIGKIIATSTKTLAASAGMGAVCYYLAFHLLSALPVIAMTVSLIAGIVSFFIFSSNNREFDERKPVLSVLLKERVSGRKLQAVKWNRSGER